MDLKHLKMTKDVITNCFELEDLTREAYPFEEELSRTRAGELVSQFTEWPEYLRQFTQFTMELAPKESAYEMMKVMAQRCERSKELQYVTV
ncbi:hypothetical protein Y032_0215g2349 [Ancylostoma ceylanicum]|uniref:Uncharacterized protein n=1 Tax=Ancylostoma ceylanicum TaxID=53326 RepID=A0A016SJ93_9BILA|nr:hypothetical protein Y032_0215g2349 [Ancylostoma ceylanicum]